MDEKDRFGNKLKEKERAEEDLYFAKRDRELLDKIKKKEADASKTQAAFSPGLCPKCGGALAERKVEEVAVDECGSCHGIWLDAGELEVLSRREKESWLGRLLRR